MSCEAEALRQEMEGSLALLWESVLFFKFSLLLKRGMGGGGRRGEEGARASSLFLLLPALPSRPSGQLCDAGRRDCHSSFSCLGAVNLGWVPRGLSVVVSLSRLHLLGRRSVCSMPELYSGGGSVMRGRR